MSYGKLLFCRTLRRRLGVAAFRFIQLVDDFAEALIHQLVEVFFENFFAREVQQLTCGTKCQHRSADELLQLRNDAGLQTNAGIKQLLNITGILAQTAKLFCALPKQATCGGGIIGLHIKVLLSCFPHIMRVQLLLYHKTHKKSK